MKTAAATTDERLEQLIATVDGVIEDLDIEARRADSDGNYNAAAAMRTFKVVLKGAVGDAR